MRRMLVVALILAGWCAVSLADSLNVRTIGVCNTSDPVRSVALSGNYAYVVAGNGGLQIIDISDRTSPSIIGSCADAVSSWDVAVSGNYA